jgi:hypothetical protein
MATSAIDSADLLKLRGSQQVERLDIYAVKAETVATATITAVPASFPFVQVTVGSTSNWSDVEVGMLVHIHNSGTTRCYAVVRKSPLSDTLYISTTYSGSPGYPQLIESVVQVGDSVTIYKHLPPWGMYSTIQERVFYMQWDVPYTDQNISPPPVANAGPWQGAKIAVGGSASFTLPKGSSNTSYSINDASIVGGYQWELPTGVTLTSGMLTSAVIGVSATAGQHLIKLTITDENSKVSVAYTWLFVADGVNYTSLDQDYTLTGASISRTREGHEATLNIVCNDYDLLPSTGVLIQEVAHFDGGALTAGVLLDTFIGYVSELDISHDSEIGEIELTVLGPKPYAKHVVHVAQYVEGVNSTPTNWAEVNYIISNNEFTLYHCMKWLCPNMLAMHDFDAGNHAYNEPYVGIHNYEGTNLAAAMDLAARNLLGNVGSAADGTIVLRKNPIYRDTTTRNAVAVLMTIDARDLLKGVIRWLKRQTSAMMEVKTSCINWSGENTTKGWLGWKRWYQGTASDELPSFYVTPAEGLAELLRVTGHFMAEKNSPYGPTPTPYAYNLDVFDPVYLLWSRYDYDASFDPTGIGFDSNRIQHQSVSVEYGLDDGDITKFVTGTIVHETFGLPGEERIIGSSSLLSNPDYEPYSPGNDKLPTAMHIVNDAGAWANTYTAQSASPQWNNLSSKVTGTVCDICIDWGSPGFTGSNDSLAIGMYVVSISGTTVYLYCVYDIYAANIVVSEVETWTMADTTATTNAQVRVSKYAPEHIAVGVKDGTGIKVARSSNSGSTFGSLTQIGSSITDDSYNNNAPFGMAYDLEFLYVPGPDGTGEYGIYMAEGTGSFSALSSTPRYQSPPTAIAIDGNGDLYVSFTTYAEETISIPFGGVGHTNYSLDSTIAQITTTEETTGGNPSDHMQVDVTADYTSPTVQRGRIDIDGFPNGAYIKRIELDAKWDSAGGTRNIIASGLNGGNVTIADVTGAAPSIWTEYGANVRRTLSSTDLIIAIAPGITAASDAAYIDNIVVTYRSQTPAIYYCELPSSSPSWTNVSPYTGAYCKYPGGLAVDRANNDNIECMTYDDDTEVGEWWYSTDAAQTWSQESDDTDYRFVERSAEFILLAGDDALATTPDDGTVIDSRIGNLGSVITVSEIKRVVHTQ